MRILLQAALCCVLLLSVLAAPAPAGGPLPAPGQTLPTLSLKVPAFGQDAAELGVAGKKTFRLQDLKAKVVVLEVIGVYCSECTKQVRSFNTLYARLARRIQSGEVRMLGLAAGGTEMEVKSLRKTGIYKYPVVADEKYANHKLLHEPKTPFTMLVTPGARCSLSTSASTTTSRACLRASGTRSSSMETSMDTGRETAAGGPAAGPDSGDGHAPGA